MLLEGISKIFIVKKFIEGDSAKSSILIVLRYLVLNLFPLEIIWNNKSMRFLFVLKLNLIVNSI